MTEAPHAVVVGAGIGGLSAAVALRRVGWQVTVYERAGEFGEAGVGITVFGNAVRALDQLGIGLPAGAPLGGVRTWSGRWLITAPARDPVDLLGAPLVGIHRAELHRRLLDALPADVVHTGVEVTEVPDADLVVAADGFDSRLRALCWPEVPAPVHNGVTTWRGVSPPPAGGRPTLTNSWGRGSEFGIVPLTDGRVYWFGAIPAPPGVSHTDQRAAAREHFAGWHRPIPELIDTSSTILHLDIRHLATLPRSFVRGQVVLLGDAAHAMPPNLGQGGGLAIEDAVVLAAALGDEPDLPAALARYNAQRHPRTSALAREATRLGRMMTIANPATVAARDTVARLLPNGLLIHGMARTARWQPPSLDTQPPAHR